MHQSYYARYLSLSFLILFGIFICLLTAWAGAAGLAGSGQNSLAIGIDSPYGYAWGANQVGQVGADTGGKSRKYPFLWSPDGMSASAETTAPAWIQVASGEWHSVALRDDGTVWTWGQNGHGQLGDGTTRDRSTPAQVPGLRDVIAIAAGKYHSLAVTRTGGVWAWGNNQYRQLGNNSSDGALTPTPVVIEVPGTDTRPPTFPPLTGVIAVAASEVHSVALKSDGTVWAWGDNEYGQLGTGNTLGSATAQQVLELTRIKAIVAGGYASTSVTTGAAYTLARDAEGTVWGWGNNAKCQLLGERTSAPQMTPKPLSDLNPRILGEIEVLAGGGAHGVALLTDGRVVTWGDNQHGQLGDGSSTPTCMPIVTNVNDVETISAGEAHTLVTRRDGAVLAWGNNQYGQLGDGTANDNPTPAPVKGVCGVGALNLKNAPPAGCPLTLSTAGEGRGTVDGEGEYAAGASVTLTATPDASSRFDGWMPEPCAASFTMPAEALACTAKFTRMETAIYALSLNKTGEGRDVITGSGNYTAGETVTLTAEPDRNSQFTGWSPAPCAANFTMPAYDLTCTATFKPAPIVPLTLLQEGSGQGTVSGSGQYQAGETVTLTATPRSDESQFAGWTPAPCAAVFTMPGEPLTCTATFITAPDPQVVALIGATYQTVLDRAPETAEQIQWTEEVARMEQLGVDRAEVFRLITGQLFTGTEYRGRHTSDAQYIADLFQTFWRRAPSADETMTWTESLAAGLPREVVLYHFLFSAEFATYLETQLGAATSRPELLTIVDFYRGLLDRLPEEEGFRYWQDRFQTAQCQGATALTAEVEAISSQFANTPEYLNRHRSNQEYLQDLYNAFLRRGAEVDGFNYWLNRLESGDLTREQIRQFFVAAPEFQERVGQIIEKGCVQLTFTEVSAGSWHTCGLTRDGAVVCWGQNLEGKATPPTGTFIQVSAGDAHTCGLKRDGVIECWGSSRFGQATPPAGIFTQISAGSDHTCGLKTDGSVICWGSNTDFEDNIVGQAEAPVGVFTQVSAGWYHTCALKMDGAVVCWGRDLEGQTTPPAGHFTQVSAGGLHTCGVTSDHTVECWGWNYNGSTTPPAGRFTQVSVGGFYTCGLKQEGAIACWGDNEFGQAMPPSSGVFTQVTANWRHACGLTADGTIDCWGDNRDGRTASPIGISYMFLKVVLTAGAGVVVSHPAGIECGVDCGENYPSGTVVTLEATPAPDLRFSHWNGACSGAAPTCQVTMIDAQSAEAVFISAINVSPQISAGATQTCHLKSDGTFDCWGYLGTQAPPAGPFTQISVGAGHYCGLKHDGTIDCWGWNDDGQATPPADVFTQVDAGGWSTCGVTSDGAVVCWGQNDYGQATPPVRAFTQVSVGGGHACGVKRDGAIVCWGSNGVDNDGRATPPAGIFTQVSVGETHTCGLKNDGEVQCWGGDWFGQATPPGGIFIQVSAGGLHTCGIKEDGTVACWGDNEYGQAARPAGIFNYISAGWYHTCGLKTDGAIVCWGNNEDGQSTPP